MILNQGKNSNYFLYYLLVLSEFLICKVLLLTNFNFQANTY